MSAARLHPDDLELLADLIAERLRPEPEPVLLTAQQVAERFGLSAEWVRDNASDLGVIRIGDGPRPRLRFEAEVVLSALRSREEGRRSPTRHVQQAPRGTAPIARAKSSDRTNATGVLSVFSSDSGSNDKSGPGAAATARGLATRNDPSTRDEAIAASRAPGRCPQGGR